VLCVGALSIGAGCGDFFDVNVDLPAKVLAADFGSTQGTVPAIPCDPAADDPCAASGGDVQAAADLSGASPPVDVSVVLRCDASTARCYAAAQARLPLAVEVLGDDGFGTTIARNALWIVRAVDVRYTVPTNTLTFDVPVASVYVGPTGTKRETDPGVVPVAPIGPLAAGEAVTDEKHLVLRDGSPGRGLIEQSIHTRSPFVFLLVLAPRIDAGAPIPAGALAVRIAPRIVMGL
jgi:hypothetical protein